MEKKDKNGHRRPEEYLRVEQPQVVLFEHSWPLSYKYLPGVQVSHISVCDVSSLGFSPAVCLSFHSDEQSSTTEAEAARSQLELNVSRLLWTSQNKPSGHTELYPAGVSAVNTRSFMLGTVLAAGTQCCVCMYTGNCQSLDLCTY